MLRKAIGWVIPCKSLNINSHKRRAYRCSSTVTAGESRNINTVPRDILRFRTKTRSFLSTVFNAPAKGVILEIL